MAAAAAGCAACDCAGAGGRRSLCNGRTTFYFFLWSKMAPALTEPAAGPGDRTAAWLLRVLGRGSRSPAEFLMSYKLNACSLGDLFGLPLDGHSWNTEMVDLKKFRNAFST